MSKAKPLMFGAALGASAMFFAQQYHVVQSHDGLQVIPRTPQTSIGLAYADIRNWSPSQWTDRPELARALMAHGSSDLIAESVASTLADRVSEDTSTLDELRDFLNGTKKELSSEGEIEFPDLTAPRATKPIDDAEKSDNDLFRIPFPQDAKTKAPADPFREARSADKSESLASDAGSRFSSDDLLNDVRESTFNEVTERPSASSTVTPPKNSATPSTSSTNAKTTKSIAEQAREMEELIFGKAPPASSSGAKAAAPTPKPIPKPSETDSMFEEVTTQLENRAQEALSRAQDAVKNKTSSAVENSTNSSLNFVRDRAAEMVPEAAKSMLNGSGSVTEKVSSSPLLDFDPFLE
jgi:hypothetical protein